MVVHEIATAEWRTMSDIIENGITRESWRFKIAESVESGGASSVNVIGSYLFVNVPTEDAGYIFIIVQLLIRSN